LPAVGDLAARYASALLDPNTNPSKANALLLDAVETGLSPTAIAVEIIPAALAAVGRAWEEGEASVADEHLATEAVKAALRDLATRFPRHAPREATIVIAAVEGELHSLGSRMLGDILEADGWDVLYVGAAAPTDALVGLVRDRAPTVVALSTTLSTHLPALEDAVARLRAPDMPPTFVLVGGQACAAQPDLAERLGADACELRADTAVELLRELGASDR
jgi:methanogenic corrinoid protein MtbC1